MGAIISVSASSVSPRLHFVSDYGRIPTVLDMKQRGGNGRGNQ